MLVTGSLNRHPAAHILRQVDLVERGTLTDFIRMAWPLVESRTYLHNWHIDAVGEHLQAITEGKLRNLVINEPPGSSKSLMVSVFWPVWEWIKRRGETRWIFASFDLGLQKRDGKRALDILQSDWFKARWGEDVKLTETDPSVLHFHTTAGGWRYGTSVRGPVTGRHADRLVVDDPIKPLEVTKGNLDRCLEWWDQTMGTRQADPSTTARVVMMQRLHERDLAGEMISRGDYEVLRLPMRYESRNPCVTSLGYADPRKEEGELLHPERIPEDEVKKLEKQLGPVGAAAQLQQRPTPAGGNIFHKSWMEKHYDLVPPVLDQLWQSWDMTFKGNDDSDFVCGQVWGRKGPDFYLLHLVNERLSFVDTLAEVRSVCAAWPLAVTKLVEDKANGPAVVSTLEREIAGWVLVDPRGGKLSRANAVAPLFQSGNVHLPRTAPWLPAYRQQLSGFPKAPNDDMVDCTSQALSWGLENYRNFVSMMEAIAARLKLK